MTAESRAPQEGTRCFCSSYFSSLATLWAPLFKSPEDAHLIFDKGGKKKKNLLRKKRTACLTNGASTAGVLICRTELDLYLSPCTPSI